MQVMEMGFSELRSEKAAKWLEPMAKKCSQSKSQPSPMTQHFYGCYMVLYNITHQTKGGLLLLYKHQFGFQGFNFETLSASFEQVVEKRLSNLFDLDGLFAAGCSDPTQQWLLWYLVVREYIHAIISLLHPITPVHNFEDLQHLGCNSHVLLKLNSQLLGSFCFRTGFGSPVAGHDLTVAGPLQDRQCELGTCSPSAVREVLSRLTVCYSLVPGLFECRPFEKKIS